MILALDPESEFQFLALPDSFGGVMIPTLDPES